MPAASRHSDLHDCPQHGITPIVTASVDVSFNVAGAARVGDRCGCGAVIVSGFPSLLINNRPIAHTGSLTSHGGRLLAGSPNIFVGDITQGALVVDFSRLGAIGPDGAVNENVMRSLLADPQLEQKALLMGALVQATRETRKTPELIAVAGSQHDQRSGNKMMFIGQAVRLLREFKAQKPETLRTLLVFSADYSEEMLNAAQLSATVYGAEFLTVATVATVDDWIAYLNHGKDRQLFPIGHLALFSHGVPLSIAFGYQLPAAAEMAFDLSSYQRLNPTAFEQSAHVHSFACRTSMGNEQDFFAEDTFQFRAQTEHSLAQRLADHLRVPVKAYVTRTDYKETWRSFEDRRKGDLCEFLGGSIPNESWCMQWQSLVEERVTHHRSHNFTYQKTGASNPVQPGITPIGAPGGFFEFTPR